MADNASASQEMRELARSVATRISYSQDDDGRKSIERDRRELSELVGQSQGKTTRQQAAFRSAIQATLSAALRSRPPEAAKRFPEQLMTGYAEATQTVKEVQGLSGSRLGPEWEEDKGRVRSMVEKGHLIKRQAVEQAGREQAQALHEGRKGVKRLSSGLSIE